MSGLIHFSDKQENVWIVAGWAYRQVLEDVVAHCPSDSQIAAEAILAKDVGYVFINELAPPLASRFARAIRESCEGILSGAIRSGIYEKPYGDAHTVEQYRLRLQQLLSAIPPDLAGEKT